MVSLFLVVARRSSRGVADHLIFCQPFQIGAIANQSQQDKHGGRAQAIHIKRNSGAMAAETRTKTMLINPAPTPPPVFDFNDHHECYLPGKTVNLARMLTSATDGELNDLAATRRGLLLAPLLAVLPAALFPDPAHAIDPNQTQVTLPDQMQWKPWNAGGPAGSPTVFCHFRHLVGEFGREFRAGGDCAGPCRRLCAPRRAHPAL
jgi:hypothetical protein